MANVNHLDLDINNYSLDDIYNLFKIPDEGLTESSMKKAKKIVLNMHPDKSQMDASYFRFFTAAYKRLLSVYEFQNKSSIKHINQLNRDKFDNPDNQNLLTDFLKTELQVDKDPKKFNTWFNDKFEKYKMAEENNGYGDWLKNGESSNFNLPKNTTVTTSNMNEIFEAQKKQAQELSLYNGVVNGYSTSNTTLCELNDVQSGFTSDMFAGSNGVAYTDLKQAHNESIIPVTHEDYKKMPKFKTLNDYKTHRDSQKMEPLSKLESEQLLKNEEMKLEQESAALAYKFALENEAAQKRNSLFWGEIKKIK